MLQTVRGASPDVMHVSDMVKSAQQELGRIERDRERQRIAGDIHDDLIQSVYAVGLDLQAARFDPRISKAQALDRAIAELKAVISDLRAYMGYLRDPQADGEQNVLPARVRSLLEPRAGLPRWRAEIGSMEALPGTLSRELFLIAKELVSNVRRHAGAVNASFVLSSTGDGVELCVEDDGVGFDQLVTSDGSFGLANLRERVLGLGGRLTIDSAPASGTSVHVRVPVVRD